MRLPVAIGLHRSLFLELVIVLAHVLAVIVVLAPPWPEGLKAIMLGGIAASAIRARWRWRLPTVECLRLLDDGRLECRLVGESIFTEAELLPPATVHPWLTVVPLRIAGRKLSIIVLPGSMPAENFRRLRTWLRWRADFSGAKNAA